LTVAKLPTQRDLARNRQLTLLPFEVHLLASELDLFELS
jgi:hypothetical protein